MSGVLVTGYLGERSGYGSAARAHARALAAVGAPLRLSSVAIRGGVAISDPMQEVDASGLTHLAASFLDASSAAAHVAICIPPHYPLLRRRTQREILLAAWETPWLPDDWRGLIAQADEVWVPSTFCMAALEDLHIPVHCVPHPVPVRLRGARRLLGVPDDQFVFLAVLQWQDRKNPLGLLDAFRQAFMGRSDVALLLKLGFRFARDPVADVLSRVRAIVDGWKDDGLFVYLVTEDLDDTTMGALYDRADAYVSLHRAEGFGLCLAEAMARGVPVVATGYSGNLDFMSQEEAWLVDHDLVPIRQDLSFMPSFEGCVWAEPRVESAVEAMRACVARPGAAQSKAERARARMASSLSFDVVGTRMGELLDRWIGPPAPPSTLNGDAGARGVCHALGASSSPGAPMPSPEVGGPISPRER